MTFVGLLCLSLSSTKTANKHKHSALINYRRKRMSLKDSNCSPLGATRKEFNAS